ncbi:MAG: UvrB/UvrC motif-containing protein [Armatimonadetes bacterium]|nr:UvrB/UvrC motif-containing protein [Armatimonadota bacterium]
MSDDIRPLMDDWPYDPHEEMMVRRIVANDGQPRLQIRVELGILELHITGRPDGRQPHGFPTLLDYHLDRARRELKEPDGERFELTHPECRELQREAMQFYHRRVSWMRLGEFALAVADAEHNLAVMDMLRERAADREDWLESEQYRAFVLSHLTRAKALDLLNQSHREAAIDALDEGIETIEAIFRQDYERPELVDHNTDLQGLRELRRSLIERPNAPVGIRRESDRERLMRELATAVEHEDYERAAELRDALSQLKTQA